MRGLTSISASNAKTEGGSCFCEACGRPFGNPIRLDNLSTTPKETYDACPFCFSKIGNNVTLAKPEISIDSTPEKQPLSDVIPPVEIESPKLSGCPHQFGYLKKRPKNSSIPDACLTCEKMVKCIL